MDPITSGEGYAKGNAPLGKALICHADAVAKGMKRQDAAGWVFATVMVAWAEDHGLIPQLLRAEAASDRKTHLANGGSNADWIRHAFTHLAAHPATACLEDPRYSPLTDVDPAEEPIAALLDWWADEAPDLAYPNLPTGPASITGWLLADLLQGLHGDRIAGNAFSQTPWFIADFLCDRTIVPAAATFPGTPLRLIDPAAGAGHLLAWAAIGLHTLYTAGVPGWPPVTAERSVRRILAGVHGVELDPLTAAVARLRLTVVAGALLGRDRPLRLHEIPSWVRPRIAVGNALLAGLGDPNPPGTVLDDTAHYPGILTRGTYHVVIANPPYKVIKDPVVRDAIRAAYHDVCHMQSPAGVPFSKLLFELAIRGDDEPAGLVATPEALVQDPLFDLGDGTRRPPAGTRKRRTKRERAAASAAPEPT
jgi:hypothetical protein